MHSPSHLRSLRISELLKLVMLSSKGSSRVLKKVEPRDFRSIKTIVSDTVVGATPQGCAELKRKIMEKHYYHPYSIHPGGDKLYKDLKKIY